MEREMLVHQHFEDLSRRYPSLHLTKRSEGTWSIIGQLCFSARFEGQTIDDDYLIEIIIDSKYPKLPPTAREIGSRIPKEYHHSGEDLCLGEMGEIILKFQEEPTLVLCHTWIDG